MNFNSFNLHPSIMDSIEKLGYIKPTPIQAQAIPVALEGGDVIGLAQTGTGKTAAFALPMLQRLQPGPRGKLRALVISPTRELAEQTSEVINQLGAACGIRCITVFGGVNMEQQVRNLHRRPEVVVACPGRLLDHLWRGSISLSDMEMLVIDEADRMLDMGFLPDIKHILACIMHRHQTMLFSATMPDNIKDLAQQIMQQPVTVRVDRSLPAKSISHALYPVPQHLKTDLLVEILSKTKTDSVLVFTRTKYRAERLTRQLMSYGHKVTSLQGNLSQARRQTAIAGFRRGSIKILVATDIAARGLDILSISHVINFDMPESAEDYIHRIGRTGRVDNSGDAFTFVTHEDSTRIRTLERLLGAPLQRLKVEGFDYNQKAPDKPVTRTANNFRPKRAATFSR